MKNRDGGSTPRDAQSVDEPKTRKQRTLSEMIDDSIKSEREKKQKAAADDLQKQKYLEARRQEQQKSDIAAIKQFVENVITAEKLDYIYREIEPEDCNIFSKLRQATSPESDMSLEQHERILILMHACAAAYSEDDIEQLTNFLKKAKAGQYPLLSSLPKDADAFRKASSVPDLLVSVLQQRLEFLRPGQVEEMRPTQSSSSLFQKPNPVAAQVGSFEEDKNETAFLKSLYGTDPKKLAGMIKKPPKGTSQGAMNLMKECHALNQVIATVEKIRDPDVREALSKLYVHRKQDCKHPTEYLGAIGVQLLTIQTDKALWPLAKKIAGVIDKTCGTRIVEALEKGAKSAKMDNAVTRKLSK